MELKELYAAYELVLIEFGRKTSFPYFCNHFYQLTHGVMVAQQILILFVKVRILMGQQKPAII